VRTLLTQISDAVEHLPEAAVLALDGLSWEEYEQISEELAQRPSIRITYDRGRLEVVTTSSPHERWKEFIQDLVSTFCQERAIAMESCGGFTQKRKRDKKATEADTCFYLANAREVIGKDEINLEVDPSPDIVVEVDKANQSKHKFPIYATFGVPEIWRCDLRRKRIEMYELRDNAYVEIEASRFLPRLSPAVLLEFLAKSNSEGQIAALNAFRAWVRGLQSSE
jgi:Uma2 family endonuclease